MKVIESLLDFTALALYIITTKHFGLDKAYQEAYSKLKKKVRGIRPKTLYKSLRSLVANYYIVRRLEKEVFGSHGSMRRAAKLWLCNIGLEENVLGPLIDHAKRYCRRFEKSLPRHVGREEILEKIEDPVEKLAIELSYPTWFARHMISLLGFEDAEKLLRELNEERWWIRVNTLLADPDEVREKLGDKGVIARRDKDLEYMLEVIDYEVPLHTLEEMWRGEIVFQDKASAMVVEALNPNPKDFIVDLAGAPGVKASQIMMLTENKARIILIDLSWERLKRARKLLKTYGANLDNIDIINGDASTISLRVSRRAKMLLDAPCTSSGAIGKDPAIKIHLADKAWASRFPFLQSIMLRNAVRQLREIRDSILVYATCSVLDLEGEKHFTGNDKIGEMLVEPGIPSAAPGYKRYPISSKVARFFPHLHRTQGFFIAKLSSYRA